MQVYRQSRLIAQRSTACGRVQEEGIKQLFFHLSFYYSITTTQSMAKQIMEPLIFASGISLFLYAHNSQLPLSSYVAPLPFWVSVGRPIGLVWNRSVLKQLNRDVFPAEMRNYRQLYLVSRRAIAYDLIFNHSIFHPAMAVIIIAYTYSVRKAQEKLRGEQAAPLRSLGEVVKQIAWSLLQMRALVSIASVISEYWLSYFFMQKNKEGVMNISTSSKRLLLLKEFILSLGWNAYILKKVNQNYLM